MAYEVIMPMLGMAQNSGKLLTWLKSPGEAVTIGDVLFEVETDKSVSEVEAQADGYLSHVRAAAGADIPVGEVIAAITDNPEEGDVSPLDTKEPAAEPPPEPAKEVKEPAALRPAMPQAQGGRILASQKARRLAAEAGLELSRLADAGVPQPFHVADLDRLKNLSLPSQTARAASHVSAIVPAENFDEFVRQMQEEGGINLGLSSVILAFAAAGLRKATQLDQIMLSMHGEKDETLTFVDPDRLRLSVLLNTGTVSDTPSALVLRDAGAGYVTTVALSFVEQPTLVFARTTGAIHLTLSFTREDLTPEQAIETLHELTARLAEPMLALV